MTNVIVRIADSAVVHNPAVLVTIVGSCVGIALRDPGAKIGALAHILLPSIVGSKNKDVPLKFADSAIEITVNEMIKKGCSKKRIEAKIAGGASMFEFSSSMKIGERNVEAVVNKLEEYNIPIVARDVGKNYGRTLEYHVETGVLHVKSALKEVLKI
ncbi:MAG: chemotaxis protein CheD [Candidatus Methanoperedens sp.]|jgi:chemotaxis protein CheD|nr:chemotaxis protein CheD [Candidatus Methanoperedens sp.]PKL53184.1 MAG: chemotaxis protein CheD [Candidatus Methanoperedenaceae archaeon HGW-Methanoperedenaceae-1]